MLKLPTKPTSTTTNVNLNLQSDKAPPNKKSVIVKLENVRKTYANGAVGLRDINIELYQGDFKFITGHSGS